jgi:hypothetical protein
MNVQGDPGGELMQKAAETARTALLRAQALAAAAEDLFTATLRMRDGSTGGDVQALNTAAAALGNVTREWDHALREAMEGSDRLLDALGADAGLGCSKAGARTRGHARAQTRRA